MKTKEYTIIDKNNKDIYLKLKIEFPPNNTNGIAYFFDGKSTWKQECMCAWDDITQKSENKKEYLNLIDNINYAIMGGSFWKTLRKMKDNTTVSFKEENIKVLAKQLE